MNSLERSTRKGKKFMLKVGKKTLHFGAAGMSDYTQHNDKQRRALYYSRHYAIKNISEKKISQIRKQEKERLKKGTATARTLSTLFLW